LFFACIVATSRSSGKAYPERTALPAII
jgi:hypothetical protein